MNTQLTNIADSQLNNPQLPGYQELKLISFYHDTECYRILGPVPITRDVEVALILWIPSLDAEARRNHDFTKVWIKEPLMMRFACELWRQFRKRGAALVLADAERALENAAKPLAQGLWDAQSNPELN